MRVRWLVIWCVFASCVGCVSNEYRFERMDDDRPTAIPLKLDRLYGVRDGAIVAAEGQFSDGADRISMKITLFLRPPAEFRSGTYEAMMGGKMISGPVECPSLTFQGGQTALPSVGGVFILKDDRGHALYRVRIPATPVQGRRVS